MSSYYEFLRELVDLFLTIFSPHECVEFLDASVKPRPVVARCNTLKARRKDVAAALVKRLDPHHLLTIGSEGTTPLEISGCYLIRGQDMEPLQVANGECRWDSVEFPL